MLDVAPTVVTKAAKHQREELKNPPGTVDEFLATRRLSKNSSFFA